MFITLMLAKVGISDFLPNCYLSFICCDCRVSKISDHSRPSGYTTSPRRRRFVIRRRPISTNLRRGRGLLPFILLPTLFV